MVECDILNDGLPDLLTESLDGESRERVFQHIESCSSCDQQWRRYRQIWTDLDWTDREPPARLRENFLSQVASMDRKRGTNVVSFPSASIPTLVRAAAVFVVVLLGFLAGRESAPDQLVPAADTPATVTAVEPVETFGQRRMVEASELDKMLRGDARVRNVSLASEGHEATVTFDLNSEVVVRADLSDPAFSKLMAQAVSSSEQPSHERGRMIDWIRTNYMEDQPTAEILTALLTVLRSDSNEGVRLRALDALGALEMGAGQASDLRVGLIDVLRNDPNPAIRMKAVDVLAGLSTDGFVVDADMLETLREKVEQNDENMYVRVRAAEALRQMKF